MLKINKKAFRMPRHSRSPRVLHIILALVLLLVIALASAVIWYRINTSAVDKNACAGSQCETQVFVIKSGASSTAIAEALEEKGLIRSALAFRLALIIEHRGATLKAGSYTLLKTSSVSELIEIFDKGVAAKTFRIRFDPGETLTAVKSRLRDVGYSDAEIEEALKRSYDHPLLSSKPAEASLEAYIFGETYEFYATATVSDVLLRGFDAMYDYIQENGLLGRYEAAGLSLHQALTLASIVQSEAGSLKDDMPQVAQVFLLRLSRGSALGSDAVIAYYANQQNPNRDKTDTSYLKTTPCPWNSRSCAGLPPTGISIPSREALLSVAHPASGTYLYFLTDDSGAMRYAHTQAEHDQNIRNYCKQRCKFL